jgi:hypothetical protein
MTGGDLRAIAANRAILGANRAMHTAILRMVGGN